jgi:hypothetical protein
MYILLFVGTGAVKAAMSDTDDLESPFSWKLPAADIIYFTVLLTGSTQH